jgi:hypothetical protein
MDFWNKNIKLVTQRNWKTWTQKIRQNSVKIEIKNKESSKEELINEMPWNFPYIYFKTFKGCDCYKFYPWKSNSH